MVSSSCRLRSLGFSQRRRKPLRRSDTKRSKYGWGQRARGQAGAYRAVAEALSTPDKPAFATGAVKSRGQAVAAEPYMPSYLEDLYTDGNEDVKAAVRAAWVLMY